MFAYSYCRASSTFRRDARRAGMIAASTPAAIATTVNATSSVTGSSRPTPYFDSAWVISAARKTPSGMPIAAPISAVMTLSWRTMRRACRRVMPTARSIPSSRVRS